MKTVIHHLTLLTVSVLPLARTHAAFTPSIVSADAQWVAYLDLNSLRESTLGKEMLAIASKMQPPIAEGTVQIDFQKLLATIGNVTAYGTNFSEDPKLLDGTLIFQGTADLRKIAEGFVAQATVTMPEKVVQLKDMPFEAYSMDNQLIVGFPSEPIVLVSKSRPQVIKAREVFRGASSSLAKAGKSSPLSALLKTPQKTYLMAASVIPSEKFSGAAGPQARILQMANSAAVCLGENGKLTSAHVQLVASSDDMADKLMKIVQGLAAIGSLAETNDQQLAEFLRSVTVQRDQNAVTLDLSYSSERLVQMIAQTHQPRATRRSTPSRAPNYGKVVSEWKADQDLGNPGVSAETLVYRTIDNVALQTGSTVTLVGHRDNGENARIDSVEISPQSGGMPLRFEAEGMTLRSYNIESVGSASAGKLIIATGSPATAQFQFPGVEGLYTVKVRYVDESDGKGSFSISVKDPESAVVENEWSASAGPVSVKVGPAKVQDKSTEPAANRAK